jgi:WD40 repeat protein
MMWVSRARVQLMDVGTGQLAPEQAYQDFVIGETFSPDERLAAVLVPAQEGGLIDLFTTAGEKTASLLNPDLVLSASFTPDAGVLAAGLLNNDILVWDVGAGQSVATLTGHTGQVYLVSISPDGGALISASEDNTIRLWQVSP